MLNVLHESMNPEIKERWLSALRSGDYTQDTRYLATQNSDGGFDYCCLGVLCDLAVREGAIDSPVVVDYWKRGKDSLMVQAFKLDEESLATGDILEARVLPPKVQEWAGLKSDSPGFVSRDEVHCLAELNDNGRSFSDIADLIEEHL